MDYGSLHSSVCDAYLVGLGSRVSLKKKGPLGSSSSQHRRTPEISL